MKGKKKKKISSRIEKYKSIKCEWVKKIEPFQQQQGRAEQRGTWTEYQSRVHKPIMRVAAVPACRPLYILPKRDRENEIHLSLFRPLFLSLFVEQHNHLFFWHIVNWLVYSRFLLFFSNKKRKSPQGGHFFLFWARSAIVVLYKHMQSSRVYR